MGFPYFLICYHGVVPESDSDPCDGYGETWGPEWALLPMGAIPGLPKAKSLPTIGPLGSLEPPIIGLIGFLWLLAWPSNTLREWASLKGPSDQAGTTHVCRQPKDEHGQTL